MATPEVRVVSFRAPLVPERIPFRKAEKQTSDSPMLTPKMDGVNFILQQLHMNLDNAKVPKSHFFVLPWSRYLTSNHSHSPRDIPINIYPTFGPIIGMAYCTSDSDALPSRPGCDRIKRKPLKTTNIQPRTTIFTALHRTSDISRSSNHQNKPFEYPPPDDRCPTRLPRLDAARSEFKAKSEERRYPILLYSSILSCS